MRYSFYGNASLATLPHLFWSPDIIICNGWQSSMVPIIYNQRYKKEKFYKGIKTVQVIDSIDECSVFSRKAYEAAGVKIPENIKGKSVNTFEVSSHFSDHIIVFNTPGNNVANKLLKLNGVKENEKKLSIIDLDSTETPDYSAIASEMEIILKKLSR
jgi:starch synthase